jgi:hypothetical protein
MEGEMAQAKKKGALGATFTPAWTSSPTRTSNGTG